MRRSNSNKYSELDQSAKNSGYRIALGLIMFFFGIAAVAVAEGYEGRLPYLFKDIGLAFIVAGIVTFFREVALRYWSDKEPDLRTPPGCPRVTGLRVVMMRRQGYWGYHTWYLNQLRQELLFSGRSVLHRIEDDFKKRGMPTVEEALHRKLHEGSSIKIVFCDPRWDLIPKLAELDGVPVNTLYENIAVSLAIVKRVWDKINEEHLHGDMHIGLSKELLQYAIHYTKGIDTSDEMQVLVGLYFARKEGCESPLFEVNDLSTYPKVF